MKILYSLTSLASPKTGIGHYTQHLIEGVLAHPDITDVVGMLKTSLLNRADLLKLDTNASFVPSTFFMRLKKRLFPFLRALPGAYRYRVWIEECLSKPLRTQLASEAFIYHETNFIPASYAGKLVISAHDLSYIRYPEYHPKERVNYLNRELPKALQRADKIIAVSEFSRQELLACFNLDPHKVVTVLNGVDKEFMPRKAEQVQPILDKHHIQYHQYILSVCTLEPRKNLSKLLQAFSLLPAKLRRSYPIVLVGGKGWNNQQMLNLAKPLLDAGELIITGYVPQSDLPSLYSGAKIFAYPSLYEGFGLPVLEAMASGVPVVTSNNSCLPEVSAGAALEIDPLSVEKIADALQRLLEDEALANACITKGLARAKLLTWDRCVEETVAVYRSLR